MNIALIIAPVLVKIPIILMDIKGYFLLPILGMNTRLFSLFFENGILPITKSTSQSPIRMWVSISILLSIMP
ncbi:hypothetical protein THERMOS_291 [Bathymodiolus thermophilus thioautotrophic gill symbiont]|uniref:Uncharacterized protein n=1 Tax=Bathymodiolus thermophilus thioautotrophic gill symbiont TaxID=2360 RepID=A0A8H8XD51_9GAMM|nr:hypothetical protein THERMOS_291 [Bathymodiolus thermophilus thioautotrophic gill symbiont]